MMSSNIGGLIITYEIASLFRIKLLIDDAFIDLSDLFVVNSVDKVLFFETDDGFINHIPYFRASYVIKIPKVWACHYPACNNQVSCAY